MSIGPSAAAVVAALLLFGAVGMGTVRAAPGDPPAPTRPDPLRRRSSPATYDGDGLSNYRECQLGTSPVLDDTDNDNLSDPDELTFGSNPTNPNTDGDAVRDGCEVRWKNAYGLPLDPVVPNADSDGDSDPERHRILGRHRPVPAMTPTRTCCATATNGTSCPRKAGPNQGPALRPRSRPRRRRPPRRDRGDLDRDRPERVGYRRGRVVGLYRGGSTTAPIRSTRATSRAATRPTTRSDPTTAPGTGRHGLRSARPRPEPNAGPIYQGMRQISLKIYNSNR